MCFIRDCFCTKSGPVVRVRVTQNTAQFLQVASIQVAWNLGCGIIHLSTVLSGTFSKLTCGIREGVLSSE